MKKIFSCIPVLMMLLVSMSTSAQSTVRVMTVTHGTVKVDKTSAFKNETVTVTVTPGSGYYFERQNLEVVKTVNPGMARTRGEMIPIASEIAINGSDPADLSAARTYTFVVPDDGYELQVSATFTARTSISESMVKLSATNFTYNGSDQKPTVKVTGLTSGADYTVSYAESSWKDVGTYSVKVSGKSKYKGTVTKTFTISAAAGSKVKLNKSKVVLQKGKTETLTATVSPSTLSDKSVTWKSSDTKVATVSSAGKIKGVKAGTATITCTSVVTGANATCEVTVSYVSLDKTEVAVQKGKTVTLTPTVYPSTLEDKSVTWESSNTKVATVTSTGKVKGVKAGTAAITCTSAATGFSTICIVTVGYVSLDKTEAIVKKGKTVTLTPTVYPSTLEDKSVTWASSDTKVATVSSAGKVKGVKAGTATITCTSVATGLSTTCKVTVGYVSLDKSEAIVKKGKTVTLTPTVYPSTLEDKTVTWESSDTKVATVSSTGKVKGVKAGTATITCTSVATGLSTTCKVTVGYVKLDKSEAVVKKGKTLTLTATVYPSTLEDKSVTWASSDTKVATVTSAGKVKGVKAGTATITCTSVATGLSTTCKVTVGYVSLDKSEVIVNKGKTVTLKAMVYPSTLEDKSVTWESSNTKVATVTSAGKVKGVKAGTATITCTSVATGISASCKVTVGYVSLDQSEIIVNKGKTVTLKAMAYPSTLEDKSVTWESSNTKVATVTSAGKVKGITAGTAAITCTSVATGLSTVCIVTVRSSSNARSVEGDDGELTGIDEIKENMNDDSSVSGPFDVYDLNGRKVAHQVTTLESLPNGIYIVNGRKILKKR